MLFSQCFAVLSAWDSNSGELVSLLRYSQDVSFQMIAGVQMVAEAKSLHTTTQMGQADLPECLDMAPVLAFLEFGVIF